MSKFTCDLNLLERAFVGQVVWSELSDSNNSSEDTTTTSPFAINDRECSIHIIQTACNGVFIFLLLLVGIYHKYNVKKSSSSGISNGKPGAVQSEREADAEELEFLTPKSNQQPDDAHVQTQNDKQYKESSGGGGVGDGGKSVGDICNGDEDKDGGAAVGTRTKRKPVELEEDENYEVLAKIKTRGMFCHHTSVWNITLIFILASAAELAESIILFLARRLGNDDDDMSNSEPSTRETFNNGTNHTYFSDTLINDESETVFIASDDIANYHFYRVVFDYLQLLAPAITLFTVSFLLIFYHHIESKLQAKYLVINISFFIVSSLLCWAKLYIHYYSNALSIIHVKVLVDVITCVTAAALTVILIRTYFVHRKTSWITNRQQDQTDVSNIVYRHYSSSLPSRISFYWFASLLNLGFKRPLEDEDLGELPLQEKTLHQFDRFNKFFAKEKESKAENLSLWKCFSQTLWFSMLVGGVFRLAADFSGFVAPLGIKTIVAYTSNNMTLAELHGKSEHLEISELIANGYVMAILILFFSLLQSTFSQCSTFLVNSEGIHIKIALQALIYKKSLTLSSTTHHSNTSNGDDDEEEEEEDAKSAASNPSEKSSGNPTFDKGSIANVMSEDTNNIMMFFWMAHFIWAIPLKLAILMVLLYFQLGYSAVIGAGICVVIMIPMQFVIGKRMSLNSKELMERCDERLRAISEIFQGMKLLKLHGWELIFSQQVSAIRKKELVNLDKDLLYRSMMTFLTHISSVLVTVVTFGLYPYIEEDRLEPSKVFAGLALFNQLTVPLFIFPITVPVVIDALVSTRRVREFLLLPEAASLPKPSVSSNGSTSVDVNGQGGDSASIIKATPTVNLLSAKPLNRDLQASSDSVFILENIAEQEEDEKDDPEEDETEIQTEETPETFTNAEGETVPIPKKVTPTPSVISIKSGYFSWENSGGTVDDAAEQINLQQQHGLSDINVEIPKEKLTVIVGPIGSGKTSLVSALLGEMRKVSGDFSWARGATIAYAAQKPWILNDTVRANILFGKPFLARRYEKVIVACCLKPDIDVLPEKDETEIGEKGINLSGGQKQRIAIARAFYSNTSVVILDDPLSALDVEVAHNVLHSGIRKFLLRSRRTVVLVTHHLPVLHHAHHIIAMEKCGIRIQGTMNDIEVIDNPLFLEWKEMITKKEQELQKQLEAKTAKERWSLLKLVSKIGLQFKHQAAKETVREEPKPQLVPYKKRKETFSHYKNLSHDIFMPSDECHDEMMTPLLRRRAVSRASRESRTSASSSSNKHVELQRMSSLQPESSSKGKSPMLGKKFKRIQSLQMDEEQAESGSPPTVVRARAGTYDTPQRVPQNLFKQLFSTKKTISSTGSSNPDLEKAAAAQRLESTTSGATDSDLGEDEGLDVEQSLLTREHSQDEREYGTIPMRVYMSYISACGKFLSGLYLFFSIGYEVVRVCTNFWLSDWSDTVSHSTEADYDDIMSYYFRIYVLLSVVTVSVSLLCNLLGKKAGANSREVLHTRMMDRVVRCPMRFFDSTPIGRIINRFSSDVAVVDRKLCISTQRFLQFVFLCVSAIVVNAIVNPWFLIVAVPVVLLYYYIQRFYRFSSRELQRIQAISRGPIYSHFHETLEGLSTIRAYREQRRFTEQMLEKIDEHNRADMFINVGNRWLSISLDYLGSVIVFLATLASTVSSYLYPDVVTPSMVGLAINYTLLVPVYLNWVVKFLAEVEMFMNSVERMERYSKLDIEDYEGDITASTLALMTEKWPSKGEVDFENVSVQYGPDRPAIITGLKVHIAPRQKVGICGRSGCGKSSLLMALFRISDISGGRILIDGIDVKKLPLLKLRSSLSIIPQENILFSGTLRFNLDPEMKCTDDQMWAALESCQMKDTVKEMQGQLNAEIKNGGAMFSAGQKQLLALARAILHKSKLVIMDEATSSVDIATERTLLQVVKDAFRDSTVLTIAHRLDTIIDGNRVLVLEAGNVIEDGIPSRLIKNKKSHFATMLKNADEQSRLG